MPAYFQMGHDTENLVGETDLDEYKGIILSPVNRSPEELKINIDRFRLKGKYQIIFDPQFYFPRSNRGKIQEHPYFPSDFDTADTSSLKWWENVISNLIDYATTLGVDGIISPVIMPKNWSERYYAFFIDVNNVLVENLKNSNCSVLTTVLANTCLLAEEDYLLRISSILTRNKNNNYYVVFNYDKNPRREISESQEVYGAMALIKELKDAGCNTLVSHCSSDMVLFKAAGASSCATGKFFNLRRFTKSRWEEPPGGGGQLPYWFENNLMAFLREQDLLRLLRNNLADDFLGGNYSNNYWGDKILKQLITLQGKPWLALSWRQYLSWFGKTEQAFSKNNPIEILKDWLKDAEQNWLKLEDLEILMEEPRNDGKWIRSWRQALIQFSKKYS